MDTATVTPLSAVSDVMRVVLDSPDLNHASHQVLDRMTALSETTGTGLAMAYLLLYDRESNSLKRDYFSHTVGCGQAIIHTRIPILPVDLPLSMTQNACVRAFVGGTPIETPSWVDVFMPLLSRDESDHCQAATGIKSVICYPVTAKDKQFGVVMMHLVKELPQVTDEDRKLLQVEAELLAVALRNQRLHKSVEDVTKRLNDSNKKFQEVDRLKDEFVTLASHELRTPMSAIRGSLSTILEGYAGEISTDAREFLSAAYNENERLLRLVSNLLNISRIEGGRFTFSVSSFDMSRMIEEVVAGLSMAAKEKSIFLTYEKELDHITVTADEDKVREVLINIVGNAIKYTHKGGVTVKCTVRDGMVVASVTDTGSGIAPQDQMLLFKKFSQVSHDYTKPSGGTGLGLYICKIIIEGLKGNIWLDSTLGVGSTFYFALPTESGNEL
jgi:signal transduction histidine kinase